MDIVVIHISLNPAGGGELVCLSVINAFRNSGNKVTLATVDKTDWTRLTKIFGEVTRPNREVYFFSRMPHFPFGIMNSVIPTVFFWAELLLMKLTSRSHLIINTCGEKVNSIADIAYLNGVPLRCTFALKGTNITRKCLSLLYNRFSRIFDRINPSLIIANSRFNGNLAKKCLNNRILVSYPSIRVQESTYCNDRREKNDLVLIYSRYVSTQNLEYVFGIAERVRKAHFIVIGPNADSGNTLKDLRKTSRKLSLSERVTFLSDQPLSKYLELLCTAKVFLRTLQNEPFGTSIVESMVAGCVPLVPRNGGPWYDILDRKQGKFGYGYSTLEEAAGIINTLIDNESLRRKIAVCARERARFFENSTLEYRILKIAYEVYVNKISKI